ncbi:hypothetical protein OIU79_007169 [Salix purpurea]|uniref:Uncharacterized protein n=1 Tax=Salix purpurea TaxID=77065 RepID=A0A9Q0TXA4_SALPP|nr:hypothetical protein OIU79_007169 [Salix purpurea]
MAHRIFNSKHFLFQASYANIDRIKHIVIEDSRSKQLKFQEISFQEPSPQAQLYKASRILHEELSLQSLQRGSVPPSEGSGCTHIPGRDGPSCPQVNEMHYAGKGLPSDAAFPSLTVRFRAAAIQS